MRRRDPPGLRRLHEHRPRGRRRGQGRTIWDGPRIGGQTDRNDRHTGEQRRTVRESGESQRGAGCDRGMILHFGSFLFWRLPNMYCVHVF